MLDIIILIFLLIGVIRGYLTGFVIQSLTLISIIAGIWLAVKYNHLLTPYIDKLFHVNEKTGAYLSVVIIFIAVILFSFLLGWLLTKVIDKTALGFINRVSGAIFGLLKFAFILSVLFLLIGKFDARGKLMKEQYKSESRLYEPVAKIAPFIFPKIQFEHLRHKILYGK